EISCCLVLSTSICASSSLFCSSASPSVIMHISPPCCVLRCPVVGWRCPLAQLLLVMSPMVACCPAASLSPLTDTSYCFATVVCDSRTSFSLWRLFQPP